MFIGKQNADVIEFSLAAEYQSGCRVDTNVTNRDPFYLDVVQAPIRPYAAVLFERAIQLCVSAASFDFESSVVHFGHLSICSLCKHDAPLPR